jgi:iron complex outermembrane recepter protein
MRSTIRNQALFAATALATVLAAPAYGQAEDGASTGDIIVTARRTEERLQDVPISITVFNQQELDNRNVTTATELGTYTPSLTVNARFGPDKASFALRGFSQTDTTSPTVGVYFADVVALRANGGTTSGNGAGPGAFFDLQNIQVLKGPQGTLFGRNTTGGAILLVPQRPTDQLEGYVEGSVGNYSLRRVQAVLNVPLADTFKVRLGVDRQTRDGYMRNQSPVGPRDFADSDYVSARLSILAELTPDLENYTVARYSKSDTNGMKLRLIACNEAAAANPTNRLGYFAQAGCAQLARQNARGDGFYDIENDVADPSNTLEEWQVINTTTWQASDTLTVKNIVSYGEFRETFHQSIGGERLLVPTGPNAGRSFPSTIIQNILGQFGAAQSTFTEELQLQGRTSDGRLTYQLGGYLELSDPIRGGNTTLSQGGLFCTDAQRFQCESVVPAFVGPSLGVIKNGASFRNIGFYGQATYELTEQLAITGGLRYTMDKTTGRGGRLTLRFPTPNNPVGVCANPRILPGVNTLDLNDCIVGEYVAESKKPTWVIDLTYKPITDLMVYAKYARGYRQGAVNPSNIGLETWDPEKVDTYEIGAKTTFNSGSVRGFFNIAGFWNEFSDQQLSATVVGKPGSGIPGARVIVNAGKSRIKGVEVDASATFFDSLKFDLGYAYLDAKLLEFVPRPLPADSPFFDPVFPPIDPNNPPPLPFSPKHRVTATATYTLPLDESIGRISFGATYTHTSSQVASEQTPFGVMPASDLLNLNVNWNSVAGMPIDAAFFMTNVTNEKFPVNVANNWQSNGFEAHVTNVPRMYGFRLKYRFGAN